jgi:hypothetical protein
MKPITLLFWLIFGWFAPFFAIIALYLIAMSAIIWLGVQIFVWVCQGSLKLVGIAIKKVGLYWKKRQAKQAEQLVFAEPAKQIEEAKL